MLDYQDYRFLGYDFNVSPQILDQFVKLDSNIEPNFQT